MKKEYIFLVVAFIVLLSVFVAMAWKDEVKPVSEWDDIFDVECECGNHLYSNACDLEHYKFICSKCGKVYEKGWYVWQKEIDKWDYN